MIDQGGFGLESASPTLLLIAAVPLEFSAISRRTRIASADLRWLASARLPDGDAVLVANGIGGSAASRAARKLLDLHPVRAVVSTGFAGALRQDLRAGDTFIAHSVVSAGVEHPCRIPLGSPRGSRTGVLLSLDRIIVSAREKLELGRQGADAVDMEAAAVAAVAAEREVPFYCVRSISDSAEGDLPVDFNRVLRSDGSLSLARLFRLVVGSAGAWAGLLRSRRDALSAARSLGRCLQVCEFPA